LFRRRGNCRGRRKEKETEECLEEEETVEDEGKKNKEQ
jgi:hypothetical protein